MSDLEKKNEIVKGLAQNPSPLCFLFYIRLKLLWSLLTVTRRTSLFHMTIQIIARRVALPWYLGKTLISQMNQKKSIFYVTILFHMWYSQPSLPGHLLWILVLPECDWMLSWTFMDFHGLSIISISHWNCSLVFAKELSLQEFYQSHHTYLFSPFILCSSFLISTPINTSTNHCPLPGC